MNDQNNNNEKKKTQIVQHGFKWKHEVIHLFRVFTVTRVLKEQKKIKIKNEKKRRNTNDTFF